MVYLGVVLGVVCVVWFGDLNAGVLIFNSVVVYCFFMFF